MRKQISWFPNRFDTNRARKDTEDGYRLDIVDLFSKDEEYYPCIEIKGADLHHCFRIRRICFAHGAAQIYILVLASFFRR